MAEYIDREQIERVRLEGSFYFVEHFKGDGIYCTIDAPTADVIERSKVDNAIEEINNMAYIGFYAESLGNKVLVFKDDVLEILKRNVGE